MPTSSREDFVNGLLGVIAVSVNSFRCLPYIENFRISNPVDIIPERFVNENLCNRKLCKRTAC